MIYKALAWQEPDLKPGTSWGDWDSDEMFPVAVDILDWKNLAAQREILWASMLPYVYMANAKMRFKLSTKELERVADTDL